MILKNITKLLLTLTIFLTVSTVYAQVPTQEELQDSFDQQVREGEEMMDELEEDIARQNEENVQEVTDSFNDSIKTVQEETPMEIILAAIGLTFLGSAFTSFFVLAIILLLLVFSIGGIIFDILMIVDCINREFKDRDMWLIVLIVGGVLGWGIVVSLLYYFLVKKKIEDEKSKK